jgi:hypothetical protein
VGTNAFRNGNPAVVCSGPATVDGAWVRAYGPGEEPLGLGQVDAGQVHPRKVFVRPPRDG